MVNISSGERTDVYKYIDIAKLALIYTQRNNSKIRERSRAELDAQIRAGYYVSVYGYKAATLPLSFKQLFESSF